MRRMRRIRAYHDEPEPTLADQHTCVEETADMAAAALEVFGPVIAGLPEDHAAVRYFRAIEANVSECRRDHGDALKDWRQAQADHAQEQKATEAQAWLIDVWTGAKTGTAEQIAAAAALAKS